MRDLGSCDVVDDDGPMRALVVVASRLAANLTPRNVPQLQPHNMLVAVVDGLGQAQTARVMNRSNEQSKITNCQGQQKQTVNKTETHKASFESLASISFFFVFFFLF